MRLILLLTEVCVLYILPIMYILAFFAMATIYTHIVLSNTSELTKNLLKLLTATLMLSLFFLLQVFSELAFAHKYSLDVTNALFCVVAYFDTVFAYQYNNVKMNKELDFFYKVTGMIIIACLLLNRNTEHFYSYEIINTFGLERAFPVTHVWFYAYYLYVLSLIIIHTVVFYKSTKKHNSIETRILTYISVVTSIIYIVVLFNFNTLQKNYNVLYWTVIFETIAYYVVIVKYEINSDMGKIKLHTVEDTGIPIIITKDDCKIVKYNKSALNLFNSLNLIDTERVYNISEIQNVETVFQKDDTGSTLVKENRLITVNDGSDIERYFKVSQTDVEIDSLTKLSLLTFEDMTSIKNKEYSLQKLTTIDQLTGVLNRVAFKAGALEILQSSVDTTELAYLFMLDLDHFKSINDNYGHLKGDEFLKETSAIIADAIGDVGIVGRYGGEEFCGAFKASTEEEAKLILEKLRITILNNKISIDKNDSKAVTVSIGYVRSNNKDANIDTLFRFADIALYRAKKNGRNRVVKYTTK